jgi:hypothetical protein
VVLGATLVLGLEKILASEAVASIFTAALGYMYTAGAVERVSRTRLGRRARVPTSGGSGADRG